MPADVTPIDLYRRRREPRERDANRRGRALPQREPPRPQPSRAPRAPTDDPPNAA